MSAVITWEVQWMQCYPQAEGQQDVVFQVGWQCSGTQTENAITYNGSVYSTCGVTYVAGTPYTPYNQLTQNQVLGWCWANGVDQAATEAAVQQQINNQINPPVVTPPLPWATQAA
mgnify:FL=1